ncbi:MAG TPA: hypothetical protein VF384_08855, partial [Planctomycetota bacterium]
EGHAIAGAEVTLTTTERTETASSNAAGEFELPLRWKFGTQQPSVQAMHRGFLPTREPIHFFDLKERPTRLEKDLVLKNGIALVGRAVSRSQPAGGAVVRLVTDRTDRITWFGAASDGRFFIPLQGESRIDLTIDHGQFGHAERSFVCDREATFDVGDIELSGCSPLSVRLVYPDGMSIADALVRIASSRLRPGIELKGGRGAAIWKGTTDQGGSLTLNGMEPGQHRVLLPGVLSRSSATDPPLQQVGIVSTGEPPATLLIAMHRLRLSFRLESGEAVRPESVALLWTAASENSTRSKSEEAKGESKSGVGVSASHISHRNTDMTDPWRFDRFIEYDSRWQVLAETLARDSRATALGIPSEARVVTRGTAIVSPVPARNESEVEIVLRKVETPPDTRVRQRFEFVPAPGTKLPPYVCFEVCRNGKHICYCYPAESGATHAERLLEPGDYVLTLALKDRDCRAAVTVGREEGPPIRITIR